GGVGCVPSYPWLADSWPASNLVRNGIGKDAAANCCAVKLDVSERFYNDAGISNYIAQTEKFGTVASDGPIYSTIDSGSDEMRTFNSGFPAQPTTLYASTPVVPLAAQSQYSPDPMSGHRGGKQKLNAKPVKGPNLNWTDLLPPPPPTTQLDVYDDEEEEEEGSGDEEWCPPLPERTYLMDGQQDEEVPPPPPRGEASSPATSYGQQSTATLTPSPRDEARLAGPSVSEDIPRLHQFEIPHARLPASHCLLLLFQEISHRTGPSAQTPNTSPDPEPNPQHREGPGIRIWQRPEARAQAQPEPDTRGQY
uniref:Uncharacterized protein n=1 Tax=Callorhinchus milii TaxID=7868 RepID=A0A4W3H0Z2_CALMI